MPNQAKQADNLKQLSASLQATSNYRCSLRYADQFMKLIAIVTIFAFLTGCSGDREVVSLVSLIANPDDYDGEEVVVSAFLLARKENQAIYLSKEHAVNGITPSAVWINVSESTVLRSSRSEGGWNLVETIESFDGMYVMVTGTFQKDGKSHGEFFAGTLENISMIQIL